VTRPASEAAGATPRGHLMIIGGSERLDRSLRLLWRFLQLCDAAPGRRDIVIITSATGHPAALGGEYVRHFTEMGWPPDAIHLPPLATRDEATDPGVAALIGGAAGLFMTGGDQVELVEVLQGTPAGQAMEAAYWAGAIIAGTSAGATAMGHPMIARGGGSGEVKRGEIALSPGLALAGQGLIIDTHFGRRGRFPRLVAAIAEEPSAIGVGIDENTALHIGPDSPHAEVLGSGVVYLIERPAASIQHDAEAAAVGAAPLSLYVLREGQRYDLAKPARPPAAPVAAHS
jgi:cyanophycinase